MARRRFLPLFLTQFFGAFNDNIFKQALIFYIAYSSTAEVAKYSKNFAILSVILLIVPFFLFSASAGQVADKFEKSVLVRWIKLFEIVIVSFGAVAFYYENVPMLMGLLFLLGTQSALFGPIKYSLLPQNLTDNELIGGNGMMELGTFLAILIGTILGGVLIGLDQGTVIVGVITCVVAVTGYLSSRFIPPAPSTAPDLKVSWNILSETWRIIEFTRGYHSVFLSILGISWFWSIGAAYLSLMPEFIKTDLGFNQYVADLIYALFTIGIASGSALCERLSGHKVEIGLVPFGSIGLTIFGVDFFFAAHSAPIVQANLQGIGAFIGYSGQFYFAYWRLMLDVFSLGVFGGFFIVPLYALVQSRSPVDHRSRVIAGNNIINAIVIVTVGLVNMGLGMAGLSIPYVLLVMALFNAVVAFYIYSLVPEFLMRFLVWILIHTIYKVDKQGMDKIPEQGPAVLVCNHVSFVDALVIGGCVSRPVRFVMYYKIFNIPVLNFVFRTAKAIPIASAKEDPSMLEQAFDHIADALEAGDLVCIFPEGRLTEDGNMNVFRTGVEKILQRTPVPVIPMALRGLWGSFFSCRGGKTMRGWPLRRLWSRVGLVAGDPVHASTATAPLLQEKVAALRGGQQMMGERAE